MPEAIRPSCSAASVWIVAKYMHDVVPFRSVRATAFRQTRAAKAESLNLASEGKVYLLSQSSSWRSYLGRGSGRGRQARSLVRPLDPLPERAAPDPGKRKLRRVRVRVHQPGAEEAAGRQVTDDAAAAQHHLSSLAQHLPARVGRSAAET